MKYDERACKFNMDTGCVELLLRDGRMISINCTGVEDELDVTMAQRTELDYLIYNDPLVTVFAPSFHVAAEPLSTSASFTWTLISAPASEGAAVMVLVAFVVAAV